MATLLNLTDEMVRLNEMIEAGEDIGGMLADAATDLKANLEVKIENYAGLMRDLELRAAAIKAEEERLAKRRKTLERNYDRMAEWLMESMLAMNMTKVQTPLYRVSVVANGGRPPVVVMDNALIPQRFWVEQPPELNKRAIAEALDAGEEVPGAMAGIRGQHLVIK